MIKKMYVVYLYPINTLLKLYTLLSRYLPFLSEAWYKNMYLQYLFMFYNFYSKNIFQIGY